MPGGKKLSWTPSPNAQLRGFCFLPKYYFPLSPTKGCHAGKLLATAKEGQDMKITSKRVLLLKKKGGEAGK